jgi:outer membrane putative beta-barrel porin/alpha-amylase
VIRFIAPWHPASWCAGICALVCALFRPAAAQSLDPRAYSNVPIGANFVQLSYSYESGGVSVDPSLPVTNGSATVDIETIAYSRALNAWGQSGILNLVLPYAEVSANADVAGQPRSRNVSGLGDAALRAAMNFYGAPALSQKEFAAWQQQTIVGAGLLVTAPSGSATRPSW